MDKYVKIWDVPKGQRWAHYWNYYKVHTIVGGFILILTISLIRDVFFQEKPDLVVTVASTKYFTTECDEELSRVLTSYARDYNGNNHKYIDKYQVTMSTEANADMQMVMASQTKLIAQFQNTDAAIFLLDQDIYDYLRSDEEEDLYADMAVLVGDEAAPFVSEDGKRIYLKELPAFQDNAEIQALPDLFFVIRSESNVNRKNKPEVSLTYQNSVDFLRNLVRNDAEIENES